MEIFLERVGRMLHFLDPMSKCFLQISQHEVKWMLSCSFFGRRGLQMSALAYIVRYRLSIRDQLQPFTVLELDKKESRILGHLECKEDATLS